VRPGTARAGKRRRYEHDANQSYDQAGRHCPDPPAHHRPAGSRSRAHPGAARDTRREARRGRRWVRGGVGSGLRMLLFYINRGGRGLSAARRAELQKAKRLMQAMLARRKAHGAARAR